MTDPAECNVLAPGPADAALNNSAVNFPNEYPHTTQQLHLKDSERHQLHQAVERLANNEPIDFDAFNERVIEFLHKNHKYTRETRIPEDADEDPVVRWALQPRGWALRIFCIQPRVAGARGGISGPHRVRFPRWQVG